MTNCITGNTARRPAGSAPATPTTRRARPLLLGPLLAASGLSIAQGAQAIGETTRVSVDSRGNQGNKASDAPSISADGRFVAFVSAASNLVSGDTNGTRDVFVHDRQTHRTTRISVDSAGNQGNGGWPDNTALSADGRVVAFASVASNLVPGDTNDTLDIFVHDRQTHDTTRVSVNSAGEETPRDTYTAHPAISANGRFVAFTSDATNLVPGETNRTMDVFVHDRQTHQTTCASVDSAGRQGNGDSGSVDLPNAISADGRFVAFTSVANLVPGDTTVDADVYVHDRQTGQTTRVSVDSAGNQGNGDSQDPALSADGRFVALWSFASNLVPGDTNNDYDIFVHDQQTHQTTRIILDSAGNPGLALGMLGLSADGRYVGFPAHGSLVPGDTNDAVDAFVHDRQTGQTTRVSVDSEGNQQNSHSYGAPSSADGRFVAFVSGDTNNTSGIFVRDRLLDRSASADLAIIQTVSPDPFLPLSPLTYTLTAVNHGPDAAGDVTLVDYPALLSGTVVSAVPSQGTCSQGAPLVCYFGALAPGASSTVTLTVQPKWQGTRSLHNTARISAAPVDSNVVNNRTAIRTDVAP